VKSLKEKYDSASIKKVVGWLDEREQKMKKELDGCEKRTRNDVDKNI